MITEGTGFVFLQLFQSHRSRDFPEDKWALLCVLKIFLYKDELFVLVLDVWVVSCKI